MLNRVIRVGDDGWEYEPDQRHAELIVEAMGMNAAKGVVTPGEDEKAWEEESHDQELEEEKATIFRKISARANYLAAYRGDIQYATKKTARLPIGATTPATAGLRSCPRAPRLSQLVRG